MIEESLIQETLQHFLAYSNFARTGAIITDLDGTSRHLDNGRVSIAAPVELGSEEAARLGGPFVFNTLRHPLSFLRSFGRDWYRISNAPIPDVTLNGSLLGNVTQNKGGEITFEELAAFPLLPAGDRCCPRWACAMR